MSTEPTTPPTVSELPTVSDERLLALQAELREGMTPHQTCLVCELRTDRRGEAQGIGVWQCSECFANYCEEHKDGCGVHDWSGERCSCDGHPVPWTPNPYVPEELAIVTELIAHREAARRARG